MYADAIKEFLVFPRALYAGASILEVILNNMYLTHLCVQHSKETINILLVTTFYCVHVYRVELEPIPKLIFVIIHPISNLVGASLSEPHTMA